MIAVARNRYTARRTSQVHDSALLTGTGPRQSDAAGSGERPHLAGFAAAMSATYYDAGEATYCAWIWPGVSSLRYIAASLIEPENAPLGWFGQPAVTVPPSCQYPV
jgi:hypothetical protein